MKVKNIFQGLVGLGAMISCFGVAVWSLKADLSEFKNPGDTLEKADVSFFGKIVGGMCSYSISGEGDVDGDAKSDILISEPGADNATGRTYLFLGRNLSSLGAITDLYSADHVFFGVDDNEEAGYSVSYAGDVDGDQRSDILIGAPRNSYGSYSGKAYLILAKDLSVNGGHLDKDVSLSNASYSFLGSYEDGAGETVSTAGDVDGDGYSDFMIGAPSATGYYGRTYLILGVTLKYLSQAVDLYSQADYSFEGEQDSFSGYAISSAGDVDGDGYSDILIGAPYYKNTDTGKLGRTYLFFGKSLSSLHGQISLSQANYIFDGDLHSGVSISSSEKFDGDGYSDIIIGSTVGKAYLMRGMSIISSPSQFIDLDSDSDQVFLPDSSYSSFYFSVAGTKDVDGDGLSEILVGIPQEDEDAGRVYLISSKGLDLSGNSVNLEESDYIFSGEKPYSSTGASISGTGDMNGDGFAEILIGAPFYDEFNSEGKAYLIYGAPSCGNQIVNPSANEGLNGWTAYGKTVTGKSYVGTETTLSTDPSNPAPVTNYYFVLPFNGSILAQSVANSSGTLEYHFGARVKSATTSSTGGYPYLKLELYGKEGNLLRTLSTKVVKSTTWAPVETTLSIDSTTASNVASARIFLQRTSTTAKNDYNAAHFDDVFLNFDCE